MAARRSRPNRNRHRPGEEKADARRGGAGRLRREGFGPRNRNGKTAATLTDAAEEPSDDEKGYRANRQ